MEDIKKQGGKRPNSGRKKVIDKKIPVTIYLKSSFVDVFGVDNLRSLILEYFEKLDRIK